MEQPPEAVAEGVAEIAVPAPRSWEPASRSWKPAPGAWEPASRAWEPGRPAWERPAPRAWERPLVVAPVLATLALIGGQLSSFSRPASYFSLAVGGVLVSIGLAGPPRRPSGQLASERLAAGPPPARPPEPPPTRPPGPRLARPPGPLAAGQPGSLPARPPGRSSAFPHGRRWGPAAAWWLLPFTWFAAVEAVTFLAGTRRYPTLSRLMDPLLEDEVIRSACFLGWLAAFWALVRR